MDLEVDSEVDSEGDPEVDSEVVRTLALEEAVANS